MKTSNALKTINKFNDTDLITPEFFLDGLDGKFIKLALFNKSDIKNTNKGQTQEKIKGFIGAWFESDRASIDDQLVLINNLGIIPTVITFSGNKSLHVFISYNKVLKNFDIQKSILEGLSVLVAGDPACTNLNRAMRLPGYVDDVRNQEIITINDSHYDPTFLLDLIKTLVNDKFNLSIEEAFNRLKFWNSKKDLSKMIELPALTNVEGTSLYYNNHNLPSTTELPNINIKLTNGTTINLNKIDISKKKRYDCYCPFGTHEDKNHSGYVYVNKNNVTLGCASCGQKKSYQIKKQYSNLNIEHFNSEYVPENLFTDNDKCVIISDCGTGKTYGLRQSNIINQYDSVLGTNPLISLTHNQSKFYGIECYDAQEIKTNKIATCYNSLTKFRNTDLFFIDEVDQVFQVLTSDILINKEDIFEITKEKFQVAKKAFLMSAYCDMNILNEFAKQCNMKLNVFINDFHKVQEFHSHDSITSIYLNIYKSLNNNEKCLINCNTKAEAFRCFKKLTKDFSDKKIKIISSENSSDEFEFIANINSEIIKYDILIASPSLKSGVSIEVQGWKNYVIGHSGDHGTAEDLIQASRRLRKPVETHFWVEDKELGLDCDVNNILQRRLYSININDKICTKYTGAERIPVNQDAAKFICTVEASNNKSKNKLYFNFIKLLKTMNVKIIEHKKEASNKEIKEFKKEKAQLTNEIKDDYAKKIINAKDISYEEALVINNKSYVRRESEKLESKKALIKKYYGDINIDLVKEVEFNNLNAHVKMFIKVLHNDSMNIISSKDNMMDKESKLSNPLIPAQVEAIRKIFKIYNLNLNNYVEESQNSIIYREVPSTFSINPKDIDFVELLKNKKMFESLLDLEIPSNVKEQPFKYLSLVLKRLGLRGESEYKSVRENDKVKKELKGYKISKSSIETMIFFSKNYYNEFNGMIERQNTQKEFEAKVQESIKILIKKYEDNL